GDLEGGGRRHARAAVAYFEQDFSGGSVRDHGAEGSGAGCCGNEETQNGNDNPADQLHVPVFPSTSRDNATNSSTLRVSARRVGSISACCSSASPPSDFRLCRSIFRRWPKAASVTFAR